MELHRTGKKADWEGIPAAKQNAWQQAAARTHGAITPGNAISLLGLTLVGVGLYLIAKQHLWAGLVVLVVSRLLDIADGMAADRTGTKSHVGEAVDAGFDKIAAFGALAVFATSHLLLAWLAWSIAGVAAITVLFSLGAHLAKRTVHPNIAGKLGAFVLWGALPLFALGKATGWRWITVLAEGWTVVALVLSAAATLHYMYGTLFRWGGER
jgi:phosphatidylglycerophosphate synthase